MGPPAGALYVDDIGDDGSHARQIYQSMSAGARVYSPKYSPDGKQIVFIEDDGQDYANLNVINADGSDLQTLAYNAYGQDGMATFSPNGSEIAYSQLVRQPDGTGIGELALIGSDGSSPKQLTTGVGGAGQPSFSPDGARIAFYGPYGDIWTIGTDGSDLDQITHDGDTLNPQWSPDGTHVIFDRQDWDGNWDTALYSTSADGSGFEHQMDGPEQGLDYASAVSFSPVGSSAFVTDDEYQAANFQPLLMFDSTEKWRPLNVAMFFGERHPATDPVTGQPDPNVGQPWNLFCPTSDHDNCPGLNDETDLQAHPTGSIDVSGNPAGSSPDFYYSPNASCVRGRLLDCDGTPASAVYYHVAGPSPGGYRYIDYWFFYRYDQGELDIGNHDGDWEGVTVAPSSTDPQTFAFAEFSQHGSWNSFLRQNLECDNAGQGSCGSDSIVNGADVPVEIGHRVMSFPAAGSHANYPQPSSAPPTDNGNDGTAPWGRNYDADVTTDGACPNDVPATPQNICGPSLIAFPPTANQGADWLTGPQRWTDWPGHWGISSGPISPAAPGSADHGDHFFAPWSGVNCQSLDGVSAGCPAHAQHAQPQACANWFGDGVAALACDQRVMRIALIHRGLERPGSFSLKLVNQRRKAATAPGLAQALGQPLRPGERAVLRGHVAAGTSLFIRLQAGRRLATVAFTGLPRLRGRATLIVTRRHNGSPHAVLRYGRSTLLPRFRSRRTLRRFPHRRRPAPKQHTISTKRLDGKRVSVVRLHERCVAQAVQGKTYRRDRVSCPPPRSGRRRSSKR